MFILLQLLQWGCQLIWCCYCFDVVDSSLVSAASGLNIWNMDAAVVSVMLDVGRLFVNAHIHDAGAMMATLIQSPDLQPTDAPEFIRGWRDWGVSATSSFEYLKNARI